MFTKFLTILLVALVPCYAAGQSAPISTFTVVGSDVDVAQNTITSLKEQIAKLSASDKKEIERLKTVIKSKNAAIDIAIKASEENVRLKADLTAAKKEAEDQKRVIANAKAGDVALKQQLAADSAKTKMLTDRLKTDLNAATKEAEGLKRVIASAKASDAILKQQTSAESANSKMLADKLKADLNAAKKETEDQKRVIANAKVLIDKQRSDLNAATKEAEDLKRAVANAKVSETALQQQLASDSTSAKMLTEKLKADINAARKAAEDRKRVIAKVGDIEAGPAPADNLHTLAGQIAAQAKELAMLKQQLQANTAKISVGKVERTSTPTDRPQMVYEKALEQNGEDVFLAGVSPARMAKLPSGQVVFKVALEMSDKVNKLLGPEVQSWFKTKESIFFVTSTESVHPLCQHA